MMSASTPIQAYQEKIGLLNARLKEEIKKRNTIAWARFICIVLAISAFYYLLPSGIGNAILASLLFIAIFIRLVIVATNISERISNLRLLKQINEEEIEIAAGNYFGRPTGVEMLPPLH